MALTGEEPGLRLLVHRCNSQVNLTTHPIPTASWRNRAHKFRRSKTQYDVTSVTDKQKHSTFVAISAAGEVRSTKFIIVIEDIEHVLAPGKRLGVQCVK